MTIAEYFEYSEPQEINDDIMIPEGDCNVQLYAHYRSIDFIAYENYYAKIFVAHPAQDIWALGFELKDGPNKPIIRRDCTSAIVTKGKIDKLLYGMSKVLRRNLPKRCSSILKGCVDCAERETLKYYVSKGPYLEKITI